MYYEAFHSKAWSAGLEQIPFEQGSGDADKVLAAFKTARESLVYHLNSLPGWTESLVSQLARRFFDTSVVWLDEMQRDPSQEIDRLRELLRHEYADWRLSDGRKAR